MNDRQRRKRNVNKVIFKVDTRKEAYMVSNEIHREFEIYYLTQGERLYFVENRTYALTEGSVMFVSSNRIHKTSEAGGPAHARMLLQFSPAFLSDWARMYPSVSFDYLLSQNGFAVSPRNEFSPSIRALFDEIHRLWKEQPAGYEEEMSCDTFKILLNLQRSLTGESDQEALTSAKHQKIYEVAEYISQHLESISNLDDLSARFYISKYYLAHTFKEVTGLSVIAFLNATRVQRACALLTEREMSISQIAEVVGFGTVARLTEAFKRVEGMTPREYQRHPNERQG